MTKEKISVTIDEELVKYLDKIADEYYGGSRSMFINRLITDHKDKSPMLSMEEVISRIEDVETRLNKIETAPPGVALAPSGISEEMNEEIPKAVREWVEYKLESKGYTKWSEDEKSWKTIKEVGDSPRTFQRYMNRCGLEYTGRPDFKWVRSAK